MKTTILIYIAGLSATAAMSANIDVTDQPAGHWKAIAAPSVGPHARPVASTRIWIADNRSTAIDRGAMGAKHWQWVTSSSVGPRSGPLTRHRIRLND